MKTQTAVVVQDLEKSKALALLSKAETALAETVEIEPMLNLRAMAAGMQTCALALKSPEVAEKFKIYQLRCERRAGQWLLDFGPQNGQRGPGKKPPDTSGGFLEGLGVTRHHRETWKILARPLDSDFEKWIRNCKKEGEEISQRQFMSDHRPVREPKPPEKPPSVLDRLTELVQEMSGLMYEIGTTRRPSEVKTRLAEARYALGLLDQVRAGLVELIDKFEREGA